MRAAAVLPGASLLCMLMPAAAAAAGLDPAALPNAILPAPVPRPLSSALAASHDQSDRMTVPVMIDGHGPFDFVVDTGSDRTVIATDLAARLALPPGPLAMVHSSSDERAEQTAIIEALLVGPCTLHGVRAPMLPRAAIGADGILGIDVLRNQIMTMDFRARRLHVRAASADPVDAQAIVVYGKNRYGQLILLDAAVDGQDVYVILDSGSQTSVANSKFRTLMVDGLPASEGHRPVAVLSVTGGSTQGQFGALPELTLGQMTLHDLPVVFADLYTFDLFNLRNRPAMLLGMDALRSFDVVEVDYPHRHVSFSLSHGN